MSNSDRLTGPDFLDSVADQSAAQGLPVNAAEFRQRATDWRADQARIEQLEADLARLERQLRSDNERARILDKLKTHLQAANAVLAWPPPADAEPKTLPVPTHVYLTDKAAVIVGDPQRGWDEEGPDAHNCDDMGCSTIGPHVLARVPFTDERAMSQPAEGEDIMVNTPYDVFILPLRPSGLDGNGPRFVVHVLGPEQPAAVDEARGKGVAE